MASRALGFALGAVAFGALLMKSNRGDEDTEPGCEPAEAEPAREYDPMGGTRFKRTPTPVSTARARGAIRAAFCEVFGAAPSPNQLRLLTAHSDLETDGWRAMHNFNFGNVITGGVDRDHFLQLVPEFVDGAWVRVNQKFRSYSRASEGAADWLRQLERNWPEALDVAKTGNAGAYASALKRGRKGAYYTAPEARYAGALESRLA